MSPQDVVYFFAPQQSARVTISLCASSAFSDAFDTKLYVLADLLAPKEGAVTPIACNDDFCGYQSQITVRGQHHSLPVMRFPSPAYAPEACRGMARHDSAVSPEETALQRMCVCSPRLASKMFIRRASAAWHVFVIRSILS